jgi:transcriptional regulator with XRE-family HTH domain
MHQSEIETGPMTQDEQEFFKSLGRRIAELRREQGLTQAQLGKALGLSQQQVAHFETARRRVPASVLPALAKALAVSVEELLDAQRKPKKRGPTPVLQRQLERVSELPRSRQRFVIEMLETVLQQSGQ